MNIKQQIIQTAIDNRLWDGIILEEGKFVPQGKTSLLCIAISMASVKFVKKDDPILDEIRNEISKRIDGCITVGTYFRKNGWEYDDATLQQYRKDLALQLIEHFKG